MSNQLRFWPGLVFFFFFFFFAIEVHRPLAKNPRPKQSSWNSMSIKWKLLFWDLGTLWSDQGRKGCTLGPLGRPTCLLAFESL